MENIKVRSAGRPKLNYNHNTAEAEIEKYKNGQKAIDTYRKIGISKSSFYRLLAELQIKR